MILVTASDEQISFLTVNVLVLRFNEMKALKKKEENLVPLIAAFFSPFEDQW
jgi:hypothetical protein